MQIKLQYRLGYNLCGKIWFLCFAHIFCTLQSTNALAESISPTQPYCSSSFDGTRKVDTLSRVRRLSVVFALRPSVTKSSTDFSFQNLVFWNLFEFSVAEITYLPHSESISDQINSIKSCSSRSFQQHQWHIPIPPKFSATI